VSIAALFAGGLMPGLVLALMLCLLIGWRARREAIDLPPRATAQEILRCFVIALPALLLPFVIRAAVIEGVATATEVSTVGVVYSLLVGLLIYRQFNVRRLGDILVDPDHHRHRYRDGLGAGAVRFFAGTGRNDGQSARRCRDVHGRVDCRLHYSR
jgi:TRAP-type C4-dicarboxylate transport system permease large subunit